MSGRTVYLDPTAIMRLVLDEPGAVELTGALRGTSGRVTSVISRAEAQRTAARHDAAAAARAAEILARLSLIELDRTVVAQAATLRPLALGAIDAIHVASAMLLADSLDAFLTYDPQRAEAARMVGLSVESPGADLGAPPSPRVEDEAPAPVVPIDDSKVQRVVDRLVGRLRPARIVAPGPHGTGPATGDLRLTVVLGDWSPGRDSPRQAHEAIRDLGVPVDLTFLDDDDPATTRAGRVLYQAD